MEPLGLLILSAAFQAAGNVLQKQRVASSVPNTPLAQLVRSPRAFFGPLLRDPRWLLGGFLGFAGAMAGLQALSAMDLSVLKALGRLETLFMVVAGVAFLGERLRVGETAGLLLLLGGSLLLGLRSGEASGIAATRETYLVLVAGAGGLLALLAWGRSREAGSELVLAAAAGILFGTGDILTKAATQVVAGGTAGDGFSVARSASLLGLLQTPEFALAVVGYLAGGILLQAAFSVGRVSVIGAVTTIGSVMLPIAFGLLVLREAATSDRLAGMAAIALGSALLAFLPPRAGRGRAGTVVNG